MRRPLPAHQNNVAALPCSPRAFLRTNPLRGCMKMLHQNLKISAFTAFSSLPAPCSPSAPPPQRKASRNPPVLTGQAAFTDAAHESPGIRRHLTVADLPDPAPDQSVDNGPNIVPRPANAWPIAPKGFKVELYTTGLDNPRLIRFAPNGDLFLAESETGKDQSLPRRRREGQPQTNLRLRRRPASALRHRVLSQRRAPAMGLHRRHRRHRALSIQRRRPHGERPHGAHRRSARRRASARRRPLDARSRLFAGRQQAFRFCRLALQCRRLRYSS